MYLQHFHTKVGSIFCKWRDTENSRYYCLAVIPIHMIIKVKEDGHIIVLKNSQAIASMVWWVKKYFIRWAQLSKYKNFDPDNNYLS